MRNFGFILLLLSIVPGCTVKQEEKTKMLAKNEEVATHCVGRHLIDMPHSFSPGQVTTGVFKTMGLSAQEPSFEVVVRATGMTQLQFASEVTKHRIKLKNSSSDTVDVFRLEKTLSDESVLFRVQRIDDAYISEIYFLRGGNFITVSLDSYDDKFLAAEESLIKFAAGIREQDEKISISQPQGFCLGPVIITGEFNAERGSSHFRNGRGDNFGVLIDTYKVDGRVPLLARMSGPDSLLTKFDVSHAVLRARERTAAGMHAQEWLGWTELGQQQDQKTFAFALETMRPTAGKTTPSIHLSLDTAQALEDGSPTKTVMSNEEAIQLWDAVVNSIRPAMR